VALENFRAGAHAPALFLWELTMDAISAKEGSSLEAGAKAEVSDPENAVQVPVSEQSPFAVKRDSSQNAPSAGPRSIATLPRKTGGPTSKKGKEKSRRNAIKHGIFAKVVLLDNEPAPQFDNLLQGFRNDLHPEGTLEEVLVEKLAVLMWRYRRMLVAERAEIRIEQRDSSPKAERERLQKEETLALETAAEFSNQGLLGDLQNPFGVASSVELLKTLKWFIAIRGFKPDEDLRLITRVYGVVNITEQRIMYNLLCNPGNIVHQKEFKEFDLPPEGRRAKFLDLLQAQIDKIEHFGKLMKDLSKIRERMESKAACVPEGPRLDRILRYSASLERDFDRTLNQLERLQRMRTGQAVPPTLNLNIST
jgi:hypothetical protein